MPFVKKNDSQGSQLPNDAHKIFIGRTGELHFFVQNILKPIDPTYNIISISGQGGAGKSTLLARFIDEAHSPTFKDYCLTAMIDERRTTPVSIMERFADQLQLKGKFERALRQYKETLHMLQTEQEAMQEPILHRIPDFAGAAAESVPIAGPLLREGVKAGTKHLLARYHADQRRRDTELLVDPLAALTKAFVEELNRLAETQVMLSVRRVKRLRVILFFDTFEQLAVDVVPWLLDYFLEAEIKNTVVLVIAGRDPLEQSTPEGPKRWLPYHDSHTIYSMALNSFTEDETRAYLAARGMTDGARMKTVWQLSQGLPLYLGLLTSNLTGQVDPTKDVVDNFLRWIPEQEYIKRQLALDAALFSRSFNQDDLEAFTYVPEQERPSLYRWLIGQPFVRAQGDRYRYHDIARELFRHYLYQHSRKGYHITRRALAQYYEQLLEEIHLEEGVDASNSSEWLELSLALVQQLFFLPGKANQIKIIEYILSTDYMTNREGKVEIINILIELRKEQFNNKASAQEVVEQLLNYVGTRSISQAYLRAANYLLEQIASEPTFPVKILGALYQRRGRAFLVFDEYQQATEDFNRALELDPKNIEAYIWRGRTYSELKEYQKAIAEIEHALQLAPDNERAYRILSEIYLNLNDYQQAITNIDHVLELNSHSPWVYRSRGWTYYLFNQDHQAIADFDRALELDPNYAQAYIDRGWSYYRLKEYQKALADFNRALELAPNDVQALGYRCQTYIRLQNFQQALADGNRLIEVDPHADWSYSTRSRAYMALKDYHRAIEDLDRAFELDHKEVWVYYERGLAYLWLKDIKSAKSNYAAYWNLDVSLTRKRWPRINSGWLAEWIGMCQDLPDPSTVERLEVIAVTDPEHYVASVCRGTAMWLRAAYREALAELEKATRLAPEEWDILFWKGMTHLSLEQVEEAMEAIEKALGMGMPPVLLAPLRWFEQEMPEIYGKYVVPLLAKHA